MKWKESHYAWEEERCSRNMLISRSFFEQTDIAYRGPLPRICHYMVLKADSRMSSLVPTAEHLQGSWLVCTLYAHSWETHKRSVNVLWRGIELSNCQTIPGKKSYFEAWTWLLLPIVSVLEHYCNGMHSAWHPIGRVVDSTNLQCIQACSWRLQTYAMVYQTRAGRRRTSGGRVAAWGVSC